VPTTSRKSATGRSPRRRAGPRRRSTPLAKSDARCGDNERPIRNIQIDDVTDPAAIFRRKAAAYQGAGGALGALLGGFDLNNLSTDDNRAARSEVQRSLSISSKTLQTPSTWPVCPVDDLVQALIALHGCRG